MLVKGATWRYPINNSRAHIAPWLPPSARYSLDIGQHFMRLVAWWDTRQFWYNLSAWDILVLVVSNWMKSCTGYQELIYNILAADHNTGILRTYQKTSSWNKKLLYRFTSNLWFRQCYGIKIRPQFYRGLSSPMTVVYMRHQTLIYFHALLFRIR